MAATDTSSAQQVAVAYFEAVARRDIDAAVALWQPGGRENVRGQVDTTAPDGVREFLSGMLDAMPDARMEVVSTTAEGDRCVVQWRATGTFAGEPLNGIEPTGARMELEGIDLIRVLDGKIVSNDAYFDGATIARQIGMLPPQGSTQEQRMTKAFNVKTRATRMTTGPEQIADGVWLVRGGFPSKSMNVYLVRDGDGVLMFDAGIAAMAAGVRAAAAQLGGLTRIVLGHGHQDHRGVAPSFDVPVLCHPDAREQAEGDGGYSEFDLSLLRWPGKHVYRRLLPHWDGGPVPIAGTVEEGEEIAGFEVVLLDGHAPGLIGLWRRSDRVALVSDCFYTVNPETGIKGPPRLPHRAFNRDSEQARASIRKLAALEPSAAWPGHADAVTGDVAAQLRKAADAA
jgi:glyoxylase-like metal-dependent hydrolase (beta-lactamase superfamily II)/predicted ester cyclase